MMYMDNETKKKVFSEVFRILTPGGQFHLWDLIVPKQPDGTRVTVNVYAKDHEELTAEKNFEYVVGQGLQFPQLPPFFIEAGIILLVILLLVIVLALANR